MVAKHFQEYVSLRSLEPKSLRIMKIVIVMMIICVSHVTSGCPCHMLPRSARVTCYPGHSKGKQRKAHRRHHHQLTLTTNTTKIENTKNSNYTNNANTSNNSNDAGRTTATTQKDPRGTAEGASNVSGSRANHCDDPKGPSRNRRAREQCLAHRGEPLRRPPGLAQKK